MDDHVHVGHGPCGGRGFLAIELQRRIAPSLTPGPSPRGRGVFCPHLFFQRQFALDEQAGGAARGVVAGHARFGVHDACHDFAHLAWRIELTRALAAALGKLADEIFVAAPDDIRLHITEAEAFFADALDEVGEAVIVNVADVVSGGIEIHAINDALEQHVFVCDGAEVSRELFADLICEGANDRPDRIVGIGRLQRQVEADEFFVVLHQLERLGARTDLFGHAVQLVIEHIAQAFGEDERKNVVLELGRILRAANGAGGAPDPRFKRFVVRSPSGMRLLYCCGAGLGQLP